MTARPQDGAEPETSMHSARVRTFDGIAAISSAESGRLRVRIPKRRDDPSSTLVAAPSPAHPVDDHEQTELRKCAVSVVVAGAHAAGMGECECFHSWVSRVGYNSAPTRA
jgi:hypothetical protein